jgi:hypothetical protein
MWIRAASSSRPSQAEDVQTLRVHLTVSLRCIPSRRLASITSCAAWACCFLVLAVYLHYPEPITDSGPAVGVENAYPSQPPR